MLLQGGYDFKVGTSEHGSKASACELTLPRFQHLLLVFGGPLGLEDCFAKDGSVTSKDPRNAFDMYINTCPNQGSRTIRSEEAILISLSYLQPSLAANSAIV
jgi:predicted SPOUT superfamily RNA methylase MTH1